MSGLINYLLVEYWKTHKIEDIKEIENKVHKTFKKLDKEMSFPERTDEEIDKQITKTYYEDDWKPLFKEKHIKKGNK